MLHFTRWKIIATLLTCLAGLLVALPNFFPKETVQSWPSFMPKQQLTLGLDLQGGAHLLLAMDQDEIKKDWINNLRDEARKELRDAKIGFTGIGTQGLTQLVVKLAKPEEQAAALKALNKVRQPIGNALLGAGAYDVEVSSGTEPGTIVIKESDQGLRQRVANAASASNFLDRFVGNVPAAAFDGVDGEVDAFPRPNGIPRGIICGPGDVQAAPLGLPHFPE